MSNTNVSSSALGSKCIRCGKPRVVVSTYEEKIETSTVVYTVTACSDADCQKIVDKILKEEEKKRDFVKVEQQKRETQRKEALAAKKKEKLSA